MEITRIKQKKYIFPENNGIAEDDMKAKKILAALISAVMAVQIIGVAGAVETTANESIYQYDGHTYQLFDISMTWTDAKEYCEERGGHLGLV